MTRKQLNVNLDELAAAMDMHFDGAVRHFLDTHTGTIYVLGEELLSADDEDAETVDGPEWQREERELAALIREDEDRFIPVPETQSHEAYRLMEDFVEGVTDLRLRDRLADAIAGKGAFRRFKDTLLAHPRVREQWFRFAASAKRQWAVDWLASLGIESTWQPPAVTKG